MTLDKIGVTVVLLLLFANSSAQDHVPASFKVDQIEGLHYACDNTTAPQNHFIYCSGRILQAVQAFKLFEDSKTFVDKPLKYSPVEVLKKFEERFPEDESITKGGLQEFVDENFEGTCHELADCELEDWNPNPPSFKNITNPDYHKWATGLNDIWKKLCRKMNPDIKNAPERYSLIYVEHPFVVPGGRFREFYYWDSYWTIKGLLVSGMHTTVEHMLMNFASMVEQYGMIPNGGRVYYLARSQPPLLAGMFLEYYRATGNKKFVAKYLPVLEKEFAFWNSSRRVDVTVNGETHSVFQYRADSDAPRPESFREDVEIIKQITSDSRKKTVWKDLASAAESGWDFSSRWFADRLNLASIETTNVVPVDLNAFICWNLKILQQFHGEISGNKQKVDQFGKLLDAHRSAFQAVFFVDNENQTGWFDYNLKSNVHNFEFYPSSVTPLFTKVVENLGPDMEEKIYNNMKLKGAFNEEGGVPTSLKKNTNQQWDFPNGWAPLNHMVIQAFVNAESSKVQKAGVELAKKWLHNNFHTFSKANVMWEKYDVTGKEGAGDGGEYEVQAGFGWSNGVALDLLTSLGSLIYEGKDRKISYHPKAEPFVYQNDSSKSAQSLALTILLMFIGRLLY